MSTHAQTVPGNAKQQSGPVDAKAVRGAFWTIGGYGFGYCLRLGSNIVVARLLFPEAFGLMALVVVVLQGLEMLSDTGVRQSIVQSPDGDDEGFLNTAWTIQTVRGLLLWCGALGLAWPAASFYEQPQLLWLLPAVGTCTILAGFNSTKLDSLNRKLFIGRLMGIEIASQCLEVTVKITWAVLSPTVWALVAGSLTRYASRLVLSHVAVPGSRNRFHWDGGSARSLIRFGKWIFLSTVVGYFAAQLDRLSLGKLLTMREFGLYAIAIIYARLIVDVGHKLGQYVVFPVLSQEGRTAGDVMETCVTLMRPFMWFAAAASASYFLVAPLFFEILYDPRYLDSGRIAQWLVAFVWAEVAMIGVGYVPLAMGRPQAIFFANVIRVSGLAMAAVGYLAWGLEGFICGMAGAGAVTYVYLVHILPSRKSTCLKISGQTTAALAAYTGLSSGLLALLKPEFSEVSIKVVTVFLASMPLACGAWVLLRLKRASKMKLRADKKIAGSEAC